MAQDQVSYSSCSTGCPSGRRSISPRSIPDCGKLSMLRWWWTTARISNRFAVPTLATPSSGGSSGSGHAAELESHKPLAVHVVAELFEKYRPSAVDLDRDRRDQNGRRRDEQRRRCNDDVESPLQNALEMLNGRRCTWKDTIRRVDEAASGSSRRPRPRRRTATAVAALAIPP